LELPSNCIKCGEETEDGLQLKEGFAPVCSKCTDAHMDQFLKMQQDARVLKAAGIHPKFVNRIMIQRIDSGYYDKEKTTCSS
jgi:hypothetical protein